MSAAPKKHSTSDGEITSLYSWRTGVPANTFAAKIRAVETEHHGSQPVYRLDNGRCATQALSCLVQPQSSDLVMCCQYQDKVKILHVLEREDINTVTLSTPATNVSLEANELTLVGQQSVKLVTGGDMELNAGLGKLFVCSRDLIQQVQQSLIQRCRQWIKRVDSADIHASQMLKTHAAQQMITADHDVRVDAERINMG